MIWHLRSILPCQQIPYVDLFGPKRSPAGNRSQSASSHISNLLHPQRGLCWLFWWLDGQIAREPTPLPCGCLRHLATLSDVPHWNCLFYHPNTQWIPPSISPRIPNRWLFPWLSSLLENRQHQQPPPSSLPGPRLHPLKVEVSKGSGRISLMKVSELKKAKALSFVNKITQIWPYHMVWRIKFKVLELM